MRDQREHRSVPGLLLLGVVALGMGIIAARDYVRDANGDAWCAFASPDASVALALLNLVFVAVLGAYFIIPNFRISNFHPILRGGTEAVTQSEQGFAAAIWWMGAFCILWVAEYLTRFAKALYDWTQSSYDWTQSSLPPSFPVCFSQGSNPDPTLTELRLVESVFNIGWVVALVWAAISLRRAATVSGAKPEPTPIEWGAIVAGAIGTSAILVSAAAFDFGFKSVELHRLAESFNRIGPALALWVYSIALQTAFGHRSLDLTGETVSSMPTSSGSLLVLICRGYALVQLVPAIGNLTGLLMPVDPQVGVLVLALALPFKIPFLWSFNVVIDHLRLLDYFDYHSSPTVWVRPAAVRGTLTHPDRVTDGAIVWVNREASNYGLRVGSSLRQSIAPRHERSPLPSDLICLEFDVDARWPRQMFSVEIRNFSRDQLVLLRPVDLTEVLHHLRPDLDAYRQSNEAGTTGDEAERVNAANRLADFLDHALRVAVPRDDDSESAGDWCLRRAINEELAPFRVPLTPSELQVRYRIEGTKHTASRELRREGAVRGPADSTEPLRVQGPQESFRLLFRECVINAIRGAADYYVMMNGTARLPPEEPMVAVDAIVEAEWTVVTIRNPSLPLNTSPAGGRGIRVNAMLASLAGWQLGCPTKEEVSESGSYKVEIRMPNVLMRST